MKYLKNGGFVKLLEPKASLWFTPVCSFVSQLVSQLVNMSHLDGPTVVRPHRGFRLYIHSLRWPCFILCCDG